MLRQQQRKRQTQGYTLVELLVVMAVMVILLGVGAWAWKGITTRDRPYTAATVLQGWLVQAQARARYDRIATGVQLYPEPLCYLQDPGALTGGFWFQQQNPAINLVDGVPTLVLKPPPRDAAFCPWNGMYVQGGVAYPDPDQVGNPGGVILYNADVSLLAVGDYLLYKDSFPRYILGLTGFSSLGVPCIALQLQTPLDSSNQPTLNWQVIRAPRRLLGEDILTLPEGWSLKLGANTLVLFQPNGMLDPRSTGGSMGGSMEGGYLLPLYDAEGNPGRYAVRIRKQGDITLEDYP